MNQRLIGEYSFMIARHCVGLVSGVLDEEQRRQAMEGFFELIKQGLESFCIQHDRIRQRLKPLDN